MCSMCDEGPEYEDGTQVFEKACCMNCGSEVCFDGNDGARLPCSEWDNGFLECKECYLDAEVAKSASMSVDD